MGPQTVFEKGPEIKKIPDKDADGTQIISAAPRLRNIRAEVVKLVPTALKVKRAQQAPKGKPKINMFSKPNNASKPAPTVEEKKEPEPPKKHTKDAVYANFMNEMEGFL